MAEAEEVLGDAARHVTAHALRLCSDWRAARRPPPLELTDARRRLELLIEALVGCRIGVRAANPPAPRSALARMWRRRPAPRAQALPATDGAAVFLPARLVCEDPEIGFDRLRCVAVQQALKCLRSTATWYPHGQPQALADLYLISETAAADRQLLSLAPGYGSSLAAARRAALAARPALASLPRGERAIEAVYRALLESSAGEAPRGLILAEHPCSSLAWAEEKVAELARAEFGSTAISRDAYLGDILRPEAAPPAAAVDERPASHERRTAPRSAKLRRRPRVRPPGDGEDEAQSSVWMVQTSEPLEHAEDPMGLQRPTDRDEGADPSGLADSLAELSEARLVRTAQPAKEVLLSDDPPPVSRQPSPATAVSKETLHYPEWDWRSNAYRPQGVAVRIRKAPEGPSDWVDQVLAARRGMLLQVQRRFEAIRARRCVRPQQTEGDEIDLQAYVQTYAEIRAQLPRSDRLYQMHRPARRDLALLMLVDVSGSTDGWVSAGSRVIDVEKEALLVVTIALKALGTACAIQAFSGRGSDAVSVWPIKSFAESYDSRICRRIAALEPEEFTRTGAAIRHGVGELMRAPAYRRLLLLLSDGKPNDVDEYEGRYGVEDVRQAVCEAHACGIGTYALTIDRQGAAYLPRIFGPGRYTVVREPQRLAFALVEWLRNAALAGE